MAERAGLPGEVVRHISGYSTRAGAAQGMVAEGKLGARNRAEAVRRAREIGLIPGDP